MSEEGFKKVGERRSEGAESLSERTEREESWTENLKLLKGGGVPVLRQKSL